MSKTTLPGFGDCRKETVLERYASYLLPKAPLRAYPRDLMNLHSQLSFSAGLGRADGSEIRWLPLPKSVAIGSYQKQKAGIAGNEI